MRRFRRNGFEARGQFARVFIGDAAALNDALTLAIGVSPNIARQLQGYYLEASRSVPACRDRSTRSHSSRGIEDFDTQFKMPEGYQPIPDFNRRAWALGATYYLDPDVAVKFDYTHQSSEATIRRAPRSINVGLGWWF